MRDFLLHAIIGFANAVVFSLVINHFAVSDCTETGRFRLPFSQTHIKCEVEK